MNKNTINYILTFFCCLLFISSCTTDDYLEENDLKTERKIFSTFYEIENLSYKKSNIDYEYAMKFSYLLQKYDRLHNTNFSGLINTENIVKYNKYVKQNFIINSYESYVEARLFSKLMENANGDKWMAFPKINENKISGFIILNLNNDNSDLKFYTFNENSTFYKNNVVDFQNRYNLTLNSKIQSKNGGFDCGYGDQEPCELEGPIITPNPGGGGGYPGWGGDEGGGGGCTIYQDCEYIEEPTGGGSSAGTSKDPCEVIKPLGKSNKVKELMRDNLKNTVTGNKEYGYLITETSNGNINYIELSGSENEASINVNVDSPVDGILHSHYNGLLSIFSPDDILSLIKLNYLGLIKNNNTFLMGLVTGNNQYFLTIDNPSKFNNFTNLYITNGQLDITAQNALNLIYGSLYNINETNNSSENLKNFLNFLNGNNTGLGLAEGDTNSENWKKVSLDKNGNIIKEDCK